MTRRFEYTDRFYDDNESIDRGLGGSLASHLQAEPTSPVDRRRFLAFLGAIGFAGTTVYGIYRTTLPMPTTEVSASTIEMTPEMTGLISNLSAKSARLVHETSGFLNRHRRLFNRTVTVEWEELHEDSYEVCSGPPDNETCSTVTTEWWSNESASETVHADRYLSNAYKEGDIEYQLGTYQGAQSAARDFSRSDQYKFNYNNQASNSSQTTDASFATDYDFEWAEGEVDSGKKTLVSTLIGVPFTALGIFYDKIANGIQHGFRQVNTRSRYGKQIAKLQEVKSTRRAFMSSVAGIGLGTALSINAAKSQEIKSEKIVTEGREGIKQIISQAQSLSPEELFEYHARVSWTVYMNRIGEQARNLESISVNDVQNAVRQGIRELDRAESRCEPGGFWGIRNVRTTRKDSRYDANQIRNYVVHAREIAESFRSIKADLQTAHNNGLLEAIAPAMRASYATNGIRRVTREQNRAQLSDLALDLGVVYGSMLGVIVASEAASGLENRIYSAVQRSFDAVDRFRMGTYEVFRNLRSNAKQHLDNLNKNFELRQVVSKMLKQLKETQEAYTQTEQVNPLKPYDYLEKQIEALDPEEVIKIYWEKAVAYFTNRQMKASGTLSSIFSARPMDDDAVVDPSYMELRDKMLELMERAMKHDLVFYDLLNGGAITDGFNDKSWIDTEPNKLDIMIQNKAKRLVAIFKSMQDDLVDIGILPVEWAFAEEDGNAKTLEPDHFIEVIQKIVLLDIDTKESQRAIAELEEEFDGVISPEQKAKFMILREMDQYLSVGASISGLLIEIPAVKLDMDTSTIEQVVEHEVEIGV